MSAYVRANAAYMREMSARYPAHLVRIPQSEWPPMPALRHTPTEVWRSRYFLLMVWQDGGHERLSILRTALAATGRYAEGISWDDLQRCKAECGRGDRWAVEVFPPDDQIVNVQAMRHLWILHEPPPYGWRTGKGDS